MWSLFINNFSPGFFSLSAHCLCRSSWFRRRASEMHSVGCIAGSACDLCNLFLSDLRGICCSLFPGHTALGRSTISPAGASTSFYFAFFPVFSFGGPRISVARSARQGSLTLIGCFDSGIKVHLQILHSGCSSRPLMTPWCPAWVCSSNYLSSHL